MLRYSPTKKKTIKSKAKADATSHLDMKALNQLYDISKYARNLFVTTILGLLFLLSTLYVGSFWIQDDYKEQAAIQRLSELSSRVLTHALFLRNYEKEFSSTQTMSSVDAFRHHGEQALRIIDEMKMTMAAESVRNSLDRMTTRIQEQLQNFDLLVAEYRTVGFNDDEGLRAELRKVAHVAEGYLNEDGLSELMQVFLMIRRYEKNFLLRQHERYLVEVARGIDEFETLIKKAPFKDSTKTTIHRIAEQYRDRFNQLASKMLLIREKHRELERTYEDFSIVLGQVNDYINSLLDETRKASVRSLFQFKSTLTVVGLMMLMLAGLYGVMLMRRVSRLLSQ